MFISMCFRGLMPHRSKLTIAGFQAVLLMPALIASAQMPTIGPQVRIDLTGGTSAANEFSAAADPLDPLRVTAGWNDYRQNAWRCGFSLSFDGGETWSDFLLRPPAANQSGVEGDPFTSNLNAFEPSSTS